MGHAISADTLCVFRVEAADFDKELVSEESELSEKDGPEKLHHVAKDKQRNGQHGQLSDRYRKAIH